MSEVELSQALDMVKILHRQGNIRPAQMMTRLIDRVRQLQPLAVGASNERASGTSPSKVAFTEGSEGRE